MLLQHLWEQSKQDLVDYQKLNELAIVHGNTLCELVEGYSFEDEEVQKATKSLDKVGKALNIINKMANGPSRNKHVKSVNGHLDVVRQAIKKMVSSAKVKQEENEEDLDELLSSFLSQISDDGEDEFNFDDMGDMSDPSNDLDDQQTDGENCSMMNPSDMDDMAADSSDEMSGMDDDPDMGDSTENEEFNNRSKRLARDMKRNPEMATQRGRVKSNGDRDRNRQEMRDSVYENKSVMQFTEYLINSVND